MNDYSRITVEKIDSVTVIQKSHSEHIRIQNRPCYGLTMTRSGRQIYTLQGKSYEQVPDTLLFIPAGQTYDLVCPENGVFPLINFICTPDVLPDDFLPVPVSDIAPYLRDFDSMYHRVQTEADNRYALLSTFYRILHRLTRDSLNLTDIPAIIRNGVAYINEHLFDPTLDSKMISKASHVSEAYFRRLFTQATGVAPHQYVMGKRIEKATELLKDRQLDVDEISELCGFSSVYTFYRVFRTVTKCTPKEYRLSNPGISE